MPVLTSTPTASATAPAHVAADVAGPACSLQRSGALWQLGIEAQELTTAIGQLAEQLEADDDDSRSQALAELEAALLAEEGNKQALASAAGWPPTPATGSQIWLSRSCLSARSSILPPGPPGALRASCPSECTARLRPGLFAISCRTSRPGIDSVYIQPVQ